MTAVGGTWYVPPAGAQAQAAKSYWSLCEIKKRGARHYCNYTATGWDYPGPDAPKVCDTGLANPMSLLPDDGK